ncbi:MAG: putative endopeptidase [Acidobacteriota bacterium]|jgi:endothelin-converting enzyme/putative endopeptidase|nr:putative endopeptidase [Acidobacteriota bacterium]
MKRSLFALALFATTLFAQTEKRPLTALPYTPSLDVPSLDRKADPCTDFYQYSCGGWIVNNPIPPDQAAWSVYGKTADENAQFLWGILEDASKPSADRTPSQQKIGDYFASCMDTAAIERRGIGPLELPLARIDAMKSKRDLAPFLATEHWSSYGNGFLFGFGSDQDFGDATQVIASAGAGGLSLPDRDYYTKTDAKSQEIRDKYKAHVARMLQLIGESEKRAAADASAVLRIETELAKSSLTRVERRDPYKQYHKMSPAKLKALTPSFDWTRYLADNGLSDVKTINVSEPKFFSTVDRLLKSVSLADWKAYLRWHVAHSRASYLAEKFVAEDFDFYRKTLRGVSQMPPRWKQCVRYVDRDLGEALGEEFVRRTFTAETKQKTIEMTKLVERAMENEIRTLDWMTQPTKLRALEKLHSIANKVGYPERWRDYSKVDLQRGDFAGNVVRATRFESEREIRKIGQPLDRGEWHMTPPTVNAYYNPQMNDINFPAGVLQPPLYDPKMDDAPNYGNTGSTIGHELTHGFDDEGRKFDAQGNLKDWWTEADAKAFEERVGCLQNQYAEYVIVDDIHINSKLTSGEDVADLGGTLLAYIAWKEAVANENLQPQDGFTPDQRFFIGFAQWACSNQRPENERVNALTNPHSPGRYRINGIVSNMPEFAKAFNCGEGKPMVRKNICKIW